MSHPDQRAEHHRAAADWLRSQTGELARKVTSAHLAAHPDFQDRFGAKAKIRCEEDAAFHLHFLAEALVADTAQAFIDYIRWAKVMLQARRIGADDLIEYLKQMRLVLSDHAPYEDKALILFFLDAAMADLPTAPEKIPTFLDTSKPHAQLANEVLRSMLVLDRQTAMDAVLNAVEDDLSISDLFQHVLSPIQREVGRLWQENQITVVQEHYCTASIETMLAKLRRKFVGTPRQVRAVSLCAAGEQHCLGAKMFAELLEADGWDVTYLGPNVPTRDTILLLRKHEPNVMAISVATALGMTATRELILETKQLPKPPRVIVGGFALANNQAVAKSLGADDYAKSLSDGLEIANSWTTVGSDD